MENGTIVVNKDEFNKKIEAIKRDGVESLHIVADFDRTLTKGSLQNKKINTSTGVIVESNCLGNEFKETLHNLFKIYRPIENSNETSLELKYEKMNEWWSETLKAIINSGLNKNIVDEIIKKDEIIERENLREFLNILSKKIFHC